MNPERSTASLLANDPDVSLPYLVKSQVYTIPSPRAQRELRESLDKLKPDLVHASLTLSPLDFRLTGSLSAAGVPLVATFHPPFDSSLRNHGRHATAHIPALRAGPSSLRPGDRAQAAGGGSRTSGCSSDRLTGNHPQRRGCGALETAPKAPASAPSCSNGFVNGLGRNAFFCTWVASPPKKNVEALLRAWRLVSPEGCKLVIAGDGPLRVTLENSYDDPNMLWWGYAGRP